LEEHLFSFHREKMVKRFTPILLLVLIFLSINPRAYAEASGLGQGDQAALKARQMLAQMTPDERVGQLFLVGFKGSTIGEDSQIYDLIVQHHIGGVILLNENDNFVAAPNTISSAYQLIAQLQEAEWKASLPTSDNSSNETLLPYPIPTTAPANYIPLFIGISQEGDGYPNDQIISGLTQLPSPMAIGATWDPTLAEQVGSVEGQELSALGFNFLIGPSLDVLDSPDATLGNGVNANAFGGNPYWVGEMGGAYIEGVHRGSEGRMVVIANHFPGRGNADRPVGQEAATVRESSDQLKKTELAPFFTVTGDAQAPQSETDGLLVSHVRYQGFQGNIRPTTRPISFDPQALTQVLSLPALSSWRQAGGLLVSDDLGSPTVQNFYDPSGKSFLGRVVARDAFLAGNDLLYMGNIISTDAPDNYTTLIQTFDFFAQKYSEDSAFAQRVDNAVTRILMVKYRLYNDFSLDAVTPSESKLILINQAQSQAVVSEIARQSATLVSPSPLDLETVLPNPPGISDQIIFLTDTRTESQCSKCGEEPMLAVDALQKDIIRLYGPQSGGQVLAGRMISYSFDAIAAILPGGTGNDTLEAALRQSTWVVINMLDAEPDQPQTILLRRFLSVRQDILRNKNIIVFAFNAPFFLDATDISEITAYYCLFSKVDPFVEVAARLLFRELTPTGILPVSVSGRDYDLVTYISPDPNQLITLSQDIPSASTPISGTQTAEPTSTPYVGQSISVKTGVIVDHNGHPVPDGTEVLFTITISNSGGVFQQIEAFTSGGVASAAFNIGQAGSFDVRASSDPALRSGVLQFGVSPGGISVTYATPTEISQPTITPIITPTATPVETSPLRLGYPGFGGWITMMLVVSGLGALAFWLGDRFTSRRWGARYAICVILGGLLAYSYLAVRLPGAATYLQQNGWIGIMGIVLTGTLIGGGGGYLWYRLSGDQRSNQANNQ
jgi:beta-N-acetylhexosaminidase